MRRVFSSFDRIAVHHARNLLEAEGIRATVKNEILSSAMGELPPAECQAEVWVEERDVEKSEVVLRRRHEGPDWTCGCGEVLGAQFAQCWSCGAHRA